MNYSTFGRYLDGTASEDEVKSVFQWMEASCENKKKVIQFKKIWVMSSRSDENLEKIWNQVLLKTRREKGKFKNLYYYAKYAAAIAIVFCLGVFVHSIFLGTPAGEDPYVGEIQIDVPLGPMSNVVLPDGTKVQLNSGSRLTCAVNLDHNVREVLLEGEAFFDVARDSLRPFFVKTKKLDFKVYGTSFNIQAYYEDQEVNATLIEGSLGVVDKSGAELVRLVPGENALYRNDEQDLEIRKVDLSLYTSWKNGLITFRELTMKDIARKIERWYNVEIVIVNPKLEDQRYFGAIMKNKPVDQILEVFRLTSSLKYRIVYRADQPTLIYWE